MRDLFNKYWDIIVGVICAAAISVIAKFKLEIIQLYYSIIILVLVCIGVLRVFKREIEKRNNKEKRKHSIIDNIIDAQTTNKAISLAQKPTEEGEKIGNFIIKLWEVLKNTMEKIKTFFSKFKGYLLTIALGILTVIEMCGGFINSLFGGVLTIHGVAVLPVITLGCAIVVGILSNGYTKEQRDKIKALFTKSTSETLVLDEIKKTIKEKTAQLKQFNQLLATQTHELAILESELETLNNTAQAKQEMFTMVPQLASAEDVQLAKNAVVDCQARIADKKAEIEKTNETIKNLTTTINALKSQL